MYDLIEGDHYRATSLGRNTWKKLIGSDASLQLNCNREGFNVMGSVGGSKVRIGIIGNQENDCASPASPDSRIGFGAGGFPTGDPSCGNVGSFSSDNGDVTIRYSVAYKEIRCK